MNKVLGHSKRFLKRNASTILTCVGSAGVLATTVLAVKATPKALDLLEKAKEEKGEDLTKLEVVKVAAPSYIPSVLTGAGTIACIFGANILNKRTQAGLTGAYVLLDSSYKEYKKKVEEMLGKDAQEEIQAELAKDKYDNIDIKVEDDTILCYDEFSKQYFESTAYKVQYAEYTINRNIQMMGWATLNDFYDLLDIPPIEGGDLLGWSEGGNLARYWQSWVDFGHSTAIMDDGLECKIVTMFMEPYLDFEDEI